MEPNSPIYAYWNLPFVNQLFLWPYRILLVFFFPICSVSNLCIFHFFIPSFPLYFHFSCFNLSSHHFTLGTLYLSHFIFHKWQEQCVWYTTTFTFFLIMKSWYLDSSSTEKLGLLSLLLNLNKPMWQPQQVKYKESDAIWFPRVDPKSARHVHLAFLGYLLLKSCYKKIQALQGEAQGTREEQGRWPITPAELPDNSQH